MNNDFINIKAVDDKNREIEDTAFNVKLHYFEKIPGLDKQKVIKGNYFKLINKNKIKKSRGSSYLKDMFLESSRNLKTGKLMSCKYIQSIEEFNEFNFEVLVLIRPHGHYFLEKINKNKRKFFLDPLNEKFYYVPATLYSDLGLNSSTRGTVVCNYSGIWKRIGGKQRIRYEDKGSNELQVREIIDQVGDNLIFWKDNLKNHKLCTNCIRSCKQPCSFLFLGNKCKFRKLNRKVKS